MIEKLQRGKGLRDDEGAVFGIADHRDAKADGGGWMAKDLARELGAAKRRCTPGRAGTAVWP